MEIVFTCPGCSQELSIDDTGAGLEVNCPKCNKPLIVPRESSSSAPLKQTIPLMPFEPPPARPNAPAAAATPRAPESTRPLYSVPANTTAASPHRSPPTGPRPGPAANAYAPTPTPTVRAVVTDVDIPISQMMTIMLKWAIAALPAFSLLFFVGVLLWKVLHSVLK